MPGYNVFGDGMFFGEGMLKDVLAPVSCCFCLCWHSGCRMCGDSAETICRYGSAFRLVPRPSDLSVSAPRLLRLCRDLSACDSQRVRYACGSACVLSALYRTAAPAMRENLGHPPRRLPLWSDSELFRKFRCVVIQLWSFHHIEWTTSTGVAGEPRVRQLGQPPPHCVRRDRCRLEGV